MVLRLNKFHFVFILFLFCTSHTVWAQKENFGSLDYTFKRSHAKPTNAKKKLKIIYKRPSQNPIYSNDCVANFTASKMGFEYVTLTTDCEKSLGRKSGMEMELHNFFVEMGLFFTKGPFWKHRVKKQYLFCRERMGDVIE
jgi:hypothetical protein